MCNSIIKIYLVNLFNKRFLVVLTMCFRTLYQTYLAKKKYGLAVFLKIVLNHLLHLMTFSEGKKERWPLLWLIQVQYSEIIFSAYPNLLGSCVQSTGSTMSRENYGSCTWAQKQPSKSLTAESPLQVGWILWSDSFLMFFFLG